MVAKRPLWILNHVYKSIFVVTSHLGRGGVESRLCNATMSGMSLIKFTSIIYELFIGAVNRFGLPSRV